MKKQLQLIAPALVLFGWIAATALGAAVDEPPSAEAVLDRHIAATGGQDSYDKITNRHVVSIMEIAGQGISLKLSIWAAKPNKMYSVIESDLTGKMEQGSDGSIVWANSVMTGPQIKKGKERGQFLRDSAFDRFAYWQNFYTAASYVGVEEVDGIACDKLEMTPILVEGEEKSLPQQLYFDRSTGLLIRMDAVIDSPMGEVPTQAFFEDYREVDGIRIAHTLRMKVMGQERVVTTEKVEHNLDLPADRFDPPAEIRAILDKQAGKKEGA